MYFTSKSALQCTVNDLKKFLSLKISEGLHLDYKEQTYKNQDPSKDSKNPKKEFLKDVTSFANASGGSILIGVKEPIDGLDSAQQIQGIIDGEQVAQDLERLSSSSIDPRIVGLKIIPIKLESGLHVILIHIPASAYRPHMVVHNGHRSFYIRHSESSFPMTTHEIRESVLNSFSYEEGAQKLLQEKETEIVKYYLDRYPLFLLQAVPLISLEEPWEVHGKDFEKLVRGDDRKEKFGYYGNLSCLIGPNIGISSICGEDSREDLRWRTAVSQTGYVETIYINKDIETIHGAEAHSVHSGFCDLFRGFASLVSDALETSNTDVPYAVTCKYLKAKGTYLFSKNLRPKYYKYDRDEIIWPIHKRDIGETFDEIAEQLSQEMFNAFGIRDVTD